MAIGAIHLNASDRPTARVSVGRTAGHYSYIVVDMSQDVVLYLPYGAEGPTVARVLAAELLKAADEQDALLAGVSVSAQEDH